MVHSRLLDAATILVAACAIVITGLVIRREMMPEIPAPPVPAATEQPGWENLRTGGRSLGTTNAAVTIVEFANYECLLCRRFLNYVDSLNILGHDIRVVFRYLTPTDERVGISAIRASECAAEQGYFEPMHATLFEHEQLIGMAPWPWFARAAGVPDSTRFDNCVNTSSPMPALARDTIDARTIGVQTIPTLFIHQWRFDGLPPFDTVRVYVERLIRGESPG